MYVLAIRHQRQWTLFPPLWYFRKNRSALASRRPLTWTAVKFPLRKASKGGERDRKSTIATKWKLSTIATGLGNGHSVGYTKVLLWICPKLNPFRKVLGEWKVHPQPPNHAWLVNENSIWEIFSDFTLARISFPILRMEIYFLFSNSSVCRSLRLRLDDTSSLGDVERQSRSSTIWNFKFIFGIRHRAVSKGDFAYWNALREGGFGYFLVCKNFLRYYYTCTVINSNCRVDVFEPRTWRGILCIQQHTFDSRARYTIHVFNITPSSFSFCSPHPPHRLEIR